jgi:hypothetical protein
VDAAVAAVIGVEVEIVGVPPAMEEAAAEAALPAATLDAVAGEAALAAAALAFFAAARRLAALEAEEGVPVPEARAVAETWSVSNTTGSGETKREDLRRRLGLPLVCSGRHELCCDGMQNKCLVIVTT